MQNQYECWAENCLHHKKISVYVITSLLAELPRPSRMATKLADAI